MADWMVGKLDEDLKKTVIESVSSFLSPKDHDRNHLVEILVDLQIPPGVLAKFLGVKSPQVSAWIHSGKSVPKHHEHLLFSLLVRLLPTLRTLLTGYTRQEDSDRELFEKHPDIKKKYSRSERLEIYDKALARAEKLVEAWNKVQAAMVEYNEVIEGATE